MADAPTASKESSNGSPRRTTRKAAPVRAEQAEKPTVDLASAPKRQKRRAVVSAAPIAKLAHGTFVTPRGRIIRRAIAIQEEVPPAPKPPVARPPATTGGAFAEMDLSEPMMRAVLDLGFAEPTEIQARTIPLLRQGRDVIGQAQTGTGKTVAFGIPLVEGVIGEQRHVQALVLAPTRELALQISVELHKLTKYRPDVVIATLYGGAAYGRQIEDLKAGAQIVVGTPGRILDHMGRGTLKVERLAYLVLDEADRMLDMGFLPDVERILRRTPRGRQTALFSATVPTVIRILSRRYMFEPEQVQVKPQEATVEEVDQVYYDVAERDKLDGLLSIVKEDRPERAIIFRRTKDGADRLVNSLIRRGLAAEGIHGDLRQSFREKVLNSFREGSITYLVATDVASRGLDIPDVSHVFNYDIPEEAEAYVHRIGRTARAGRKGVAVTFVSEWDADKLKAIVAIVGDRLERKVLPIYQLDRAS